MRSLTGEKITVQMSDDSSTDASGQLEFEFSELRTVDEVLSANCEDSGYIVQNAGISDNTVTIQAYGTGDSEDAALSALSSETDIGTVTVTVAGV